MERSLYSAGELSSAAAYVCSLREEQRAASTHVPQIPEKYRGTGPQIRDLGEYERAFEEMR